MTDAYRDVSITNENKVTVQGRILFDTGATTNLVAANHPVLEKAIFRKLPNKIRVKGAFNGDPLYITDYVNLDINAKDENDDTFVIGKDIKFYVVHNQCNFSVILGMKSIKQLNISVGRQIIISKGGKKMRIKDSDKITIHENGYNDTGVLKSFFVDLDYHKDEVFLITSEDREYVVRGNSLYVPSKYSFNKDQFKVEKVQIVDFEDALDGVATDFCMRVHEMGQRDLPGLDLDNIELGEDLSKEQKDEIKGLLYEFKDVFSKNPYDLGNVKGIKYDLEVTTTVPQAARLFPLPKEQQQVVHEEILKLAKAGVISEFPDCSVITSTFIPIKKKDGTYRLVSDFRAANNVIVSSNLLIPKPTDLISKMANFRYYCATDLCKAFWGIELAESRKALFTCYDPVTGMKYHYNRMPMGSKSAAQAYHSIASQLLFQGISQESYSQYIDDVTVYDDGFGKLLNILRIFLNNHRKFGFKINAAKSQFFVSEVKMVGFYVGKNGVRMCSKKGDDFDKLEPPKTADQLRKNLCGMSYYRTVVPDFSRMAAPLYDRLKKGYKFVLDDKYIKDWENFKNNFKNRVILSRPDFDYPFQVETDASQVGTGAVLKQVINGEVRIIAVYSYKLTVTERHWECAARELLGIYKAVVHWKDYLFGRKFTIRTDSRVNTILLTAKMGQVRIDQSAVSPAYKFLTYLSKYDFNVEHISGRCKSFILSDLLSRRNLDLDQKILQLGKNFRQPLLFLKDLATGKLDKLEEKVEMVNSIKVKIPVSAQQVTKDIIEAQKLSKQVQNILADGVETGTFSISEGILYRKGRLFVPKYYVMEFLDNIHIHGQGNYGLFRMIDEYKVDFENKIEMVTKFLLSCSDCQASISGINKKYTDKTISLIDNINQQLEVDNLKFGKITVLIAIDAFSGYIRYRILKDETAKSVKGALFDLFMEHGIPRILKSDNGACFTSHELKELLSVFNIGHQTISPSNSRSNGRAENSIGRIQRELRILQPSKDDIEELKMALSLAVFNLNTKVGKNKKFSPYEIMFKIPMEFIRQIPELSKSRIESLGTHMKKAYGKAMEIRNDIMKVKKLNLEKIEMSNRNSTSIYKKGDLVKIRKVQAPGQIKKTFRPYSNRNYTVLRVLSHCNSLLLEEHGHTESVRPIRIRIHMRFVKKVLDRESLRDETDKIKLEKISYDTSLDKKEPHLNSQNDDLESGPEHGSETKALFRHNCTEKLRPRKVKVNYKL